MKTPICSLKLYLPFLILPGLFAASAPVQVFREDFSRMAAGGLPEGWKLWSPDPSLKLNTAAAKSAFRMSGNGKTSAKSRLSRTISGLKSGEWYRFEATYATANIPAPENSVLTVVQWVSDRRMRVLLPEKSVGGVTTSSLVMKLPEEAKGSLNVHLFAGFIPAGSVEWRDVKVSHLPGYVLPKRPVKVAVIDSKPAREGSIIDNARHYAAEIDKACAGTARPDIIVLPENFNRSEVKDNFVVSLDSEYVRILSEAVRRNRVYLTGSIRSAHDGAVFNTAILLDRQGKLAGTYNKTHLTVGEIVFSDLARGEEFRLFDTDFGKIAVLICWDFHFPETARLMALKGAELVLVPMAADARLKDDGLQRGAEHSGKAFVLENRIPVVFSATLGSSVQPSLIIDQHGVVLARSNDERHIIQASLDLAAKEYQWSGDDFKSTYVVGRRPELYREIGLK